MTRKIRLDVDELAVESYVTGEESQPRGTVHAHLYGSDPRTCPHTQDWHCTVNEVFCTRDDVCYLTSREHRCIED